MHDPGDATAPAPDRDGPRERVREEHPLGKVQVFGDDPLSRMTIAIKNRMSEEKQMDKFSAVFSRMIALVQLIGGQALKRWAIPKPHDPQHLYYPDGWYSPPQFRRSMTTSRSRWISLNASLRRECRA